MSITIGSKVRHKGGPLLTVVAIGRKLAESTEHTAWVVGEGEDWRRAFGREVPLDELEPAEGKS